MSFTDHSQLDLLHSRSQSAASRFLKLLRLGAGSSSYPPAATTAEQPIIPGPEVFSRLSVSRHDGNSPTQVEPNVIPTIAECAVHLELLEAFLVLKTKVIQSNAIDRAFGIAEASKKKTKTNLKLLRERKWKGYISLAVIRFEKWWQSIDQVLVAAGKTTGSLDTAPHFTPSTLPPLDVLMVWHTLMLNPKLYYSICDTECPDLWKVELPWATLHEVIDESSRAYTLPTAASTLFDSITGLPPDLFEFLSEFSKLPENARKILGLAEDRETQFSEHWALHGSLSSSPQDVMFRSYLERERNLPARFKVDAKKYTDKTLKTSFAEAFPQVKPTDEKYLGLLIKSAFPAETDYIKVQDLDSLRKILNEKLTKLLTEILTDRQNQSSYEKLMQRPIERLLSSYVTTFNMINATETEAAVLRQGEFVEKMGKYLWIRSPSLCGTLSRAISQYDKFFLLLAAFPDKIIVPTLDIDLVWHTHQCAPARYFAYSKAKTGRFINHDDSITKTTLETGLQDTKDLFYARFGENYSRCLCWDCEALLTAVEEGIGVEAEKEEKVAKRVTADVAYYRAVELARREGRMLPVRREEVL